MLAQYRAAGPEWEDLLLKMREAPDRTYDLAAMHASPALRQGTPPAINPLVGSFGAVDAFDISLLIRCTIACHLYTNGSSGSTQG
jgi:hypothetical protein